ncbi:MAG: threonine ammonia-lyase, biosynthetic [Fimbriimonas sp.]|nr:threonine ammonia-lyase, biosynthetic [Fimbriimonas sp.]
MGLLGAALDTSNAANPDWGSLKGMSSEYLKKILCARVYDVAIESPLDYAPLLSERLTNSVWLKREDLQPIFSFKIRGAYNRMVRLTDEEREQGVVASSAGNHAQGVALAAKKLGIEATIVMPTTTPKIKIDAVQRLGANVVLMGDNYDGAYEHARALSNERGLIFVHPYDDPDVIAGQGTIGMEILKQHPGEVDAIFVPVGGGGLIAGIAAYVKELRPQTAIIGVEPEDADAMARSIAAGERIRLSSVGSLADGVAVRQVGVETFRLVQELIDEVIVVSNDEICAAVKDIYEDCRSILEPSGALAFAGMKKYVEERRISHRHLVAIASGANMNFDRLRHISERAEIGERREAVLAVTIPERPGSFRQFCAAIGARSITEFNYRYADPSTAHVFVGLQIADAKELHELMNQLRAQGYEAIDLTDNEVAKLHVRHMVGGRAPNIAGERLFNFQFPERPGALLNFLQRMGQQWNISLFHYRNHGADFGRVLVGMEVGEDSADDLIAFLEDLNYVYTDESDNPALTLFLR